MGYTWAVVDMCQQIRIVCYYQQHELNMAQWKFHIKIYLIIDKLQT